MYNTSMFEINVSSTKGSFWDETQQNKIKIEEKKVFFICCETTKHIVWFFCVLVKYLQLVDSTVSENKIHSFSGLSR